MSQFPFGSTPPPDDRTQGDESWSAGAREQPPVSDAVIGDRGQLVGDEGAGGEVVGDERWTPAADTPGTSTDSGSTKDVAREEAAQTKDEAVRAGKDVAATARSEASNVAAEVRDQAADLTSRVQGEVRTQGQQQQQRLAEGLHSASHELSDMARNSQQSGIATEVTQEVAQRLSRTASWLEAREPADIVADLRGFARREPALFLLGAAGAGFLIGRLVRGIAANKKDGSNDTPALGSRSRPADPVGPQPGQGGINTGTTWDDTSLGEGLR